MDKAIENRNIKSNYEITFNDSPEYFLIENAKMIFEFNMIRFICFDNENKFKEDHWYPMVNVHRVKRYI